MPARRLEFHPRHCRTSRRSERCRSERLRPSSSTAAELDMAREHAGLACSMFGLSPVERPERVGQSDQLKPAAGARRLGKLCVGCEQRDVERLRQCDVARVVGRHVRTERPASANKWRGGVQRDLPSHRCTTQVAVRPSVGHQRRNDRGINDEHARPEVQRLRSFGRRGPSPGARSARSPRRRSGSRR